MPAERIRRALREAVDSLGAPGAEIRLERPRDAGHGDLASNVALTLASSLRRPPRAIAADLSERLAGVDGVERIEVAGPGFLNFHLSAAAVGGALPDLLDAGDDYGRTGEGAGRRVMVEFVSANPTGPLHLGHGRQAALGDAIASLLEWCGWRVHREFYFNDAGRQIERLAQSVQARCARLLGRDGEIPEGGYHGRYVEGIARDFLQRADADGVDGDAALGAMRDFAVQALRDDHKRDLADFGVVFDEYYPETRLYADGRVAATIEALDRTGLTFRRDGAHWLMSSRFGDQKDRVMVKSDGSPTYFLPDVAYHMGKWERGYQDVINVQGADHHSTVDRVRAGLQALGRPPGYPEYVLHQMVTVERAGEEVRFSKRSGSYTTLAELVAEVGADVARYFFLMRRPEAHLVFDLDLALDQSDRNPVYKVQYAHARLCRLLDVAGEQAAAAAKRTTGSQSHGTPAAAANGSGSAVPNAVTRASLRSADTALLTTAMERELVHQLSEFPSQVKRAARARAPHQICDYLERTAGLVNSWYQAGHPSRAPALRALVPEPELRAARLALVAAARTVLANGLTLLGLSAPSRMER